MRPLGHQAEWYLPWRYVIIRNSCCDARQVYRSGWGVAIVARPHPCVRAFSVMMTWVRCTAFLIVACALLCARTAFAEASGSNTANALTRDAMRGDVDNDFALERVTVDTRGKIIITIDRDRELIATFVIRNDNGFDIKDTEIVCTHFGISGTQIDSNTRTIYELVPARSWRQVRDIKMVSVR